MNEEQNENKKVNIEIKGKIELEKFDIKPYLGKEIKIEEIEVMQGKHGYFIKVITESLGDWKNAEGEKQQVRASRIFGLQKDKDNNIGWGDGTKLDLFLKKMEVEHFKDLKGKTVITQSVTRETGDYLTFN